MQGEQKIWSQIIEERREQEVRKAIDDPSGNPVEVARHYNDLIERMEHKGDEQLTPSQRKIIAARQTILELLPIKSEPFFGREDAEKEINNILDGIGAVDDIENKKQVINGEIESMVETMLRDNVEKEISIALRSFFEVPKSAGIDPVEIDKYLRAHFKKNHILTPYVAERLKHLQQEDDFESLLFEHAFEHVQNERSREFFSGIFRSRHILDSLEGLSKNADFVRVALEEDARTFNSVKGLLTLLVQKQKVKLTDLYKVADLAISEHKIDGKLVSDMLSEVRKDGYFKEFVHFDSDSIFYNEQHQIGVDARLGMEHYKKAYSDLRQKINEKIPALSGVLKPNLSLRNKLLGRDLM